MVIWRDKAALKVPIGAVFRSGDQWAAFVVDKEVARLQTVPLGQRNEREGQVSGGLAEGQTVVLHPPDTLKDGMRVKIRASQ